MANELENRSTSELQREIEKKWKEITKDSADPKGKGLIKSIEKDLESFLKGNQAAGTRARKGFQQIKNLCQELRIYIQAIKNNK